MYDLKLSRRQTLIKSSRAISRVNWQDFINYIYGRKLLPNNSDSDVKKWLVDFLLLRWGETRLCGTAAANGPIAHPQMIYEWIWSIGRIILAGETRRIRRKTYPSATSSTINPTWTELGANPDLRGEEAATNRPCYGTALGRLLWSCMWIAYRLTVHLINFVSICTFHKHVSYGNKGRVFSPFNRLCFPSYYLCSIHNYRQGRR
jgi:hypothetical protein